MTPTQLLTTWIEDEKTHGAHHAAYAVLSTQGLNDAPHGRVVAIREITKDNRILFFTQKGTRKVCEINNNKCVALTFWFERHAREVMIEGEAHFLSKEQNESYWNDSRAVQQARFCSYAPTSGQPIKDKHIIENKRLKLERAAKREPLVCPPEYCGVVIQPMRFVFYTYRTDELSDVWEYMIEDGRIHKQRLSP